MRVARIGTMRQPFPPEAYGGTQRSMSQMTAFQAAVCGHDVTLYGPANSTIIDFSAEVARRLGLKFEISGSGDSLLIHNIDGRQGRVRLRTTGQNATGYPHPDEPKRNRELFSLLLEDERRKPYDIIHSHDLRLTRDMLIPAGLAHKTLTHHHGINLKKGYRAHRFPLLCISHSQADFVKRKFDANVYDVIYHGLDAFTHHATPSHAGYLAWIGRFAEKKGAVTAIRIAHKAGVPIVLAGSLRDSSPDNQRYLEEEVMPLVDVTDCSFLDRISRMPPAQIREEIASIAGRRSAPPPVILAGPANETQKQALFGNAMATLFPIEWSEPFGRVMIESMACGTPVIGNIRVGRIHCGAVEEVIDHGVTGFHVDASDESDAVIRGAEAVEKLGELDRLEVRKAFDRRWRSERVAEQIDAVYTRYLQESVYIPAKIQRRKGWLQWVRGILSNG